MIKRRVAAWRGRPGKYRLLLLIPLLLLASGVLWWTLDGPLTPSPLQEHWLQVQPQRLESQLGLMGRIQAARQETLAAPFEGVISEIVVHEGQRVKQGQMIIALDPGQIDIQLRQAQAELFKAQKEMDRYRNWSRSPDVARARRVVQSARTALSNTQTNLRDTKALYTRGIVPRMEVDTLVQQAQSQQQELAAAQEELQAVIAQGTGEDSRIADMEWVNAKARYDALLAQSEKKIIRAPFSGLIVRPGTPDNGKPVRVQPGLLVSQGAPLLTVIGLDMIQIAAQVEEVDLHQLKEGMPVSITGDGFAGTELSGRIREIGIQNNMSETQGAYYDVIVSVDTPLAERQHEIRPGMSARLAVMTWQDEHGIAIPAQAFHTDEKTGATYVIYRQTAGGPPRHVNVTPGHSVAQGVEIHGIDAGEVLLPQ